jgi:hypothetical protein
LSLPGFGTFRVTDCERCRLEGGFICSSEPDKGRLREELLPRVLAQLFKLSKMPSSHQDCINKQNDKITSLKAENEQMKGKLVTCLSLPGFGTFRVTDCERCRLEGGFICSSEPDKGRLREKLLPRVLAFCTLCHLVVGI